MSLLPPKVACVIPARLQSTRYPRKILAPLQGKSLLQWVWEAACRVARFDSVTIALDAEETAAEVRRFGGIYQMTSPLCPSGTLRVCEAVQKGSLEGDLFVNWQGDEPFVPPEMIDDLLQNADPETGDIWTLRKRSSAVETGRSPHIVKVVTDKNGDALYFSRSFIPFSRDCLPAFYDQHIGLYAYSRRALQTIASLPLSELAQLEQLEQLNFLYHGLKIRVHTTTYESFGIDVPEQMEEARRRVLSSH